MDITFKFIFGLQSIIQKLVAHKIQKLDHEGQSFENVTKIVRKETEEYCARLMKLAANCGVVYASFSSDQDRDSHAFMTYAKKKGHAYCGP